MEPTNICVNTFDTALPGISNHKIESIIKQNFNFTKSNMKREMFFKRIQFKNTSRFGAYGKINSEYPWENAKTNLKGIPDEI